MLQYKFLGHFAQIGSGNYLSELPTESPEAVRQPVHLSELRYLEAEVAHRGGWAHPITPVPCPSSPWSLQAPGLSLACLSPTAPQPPEFLASFTHTAWR